MPELLTRTHHHGSEPAAASKKSKMEYFLKEKKNKSWLDSEYGRLVKFASLPREWKDTVSSGVSYQQCGAAKQTPTGLPTTLRMRL